MDLNEMIALMAASIYPAERAAGYEHKPAMESAVRKAKQLWLAVQTDKAKA